MMDLGLCLCIYIYVGGLYMKLVEMGKKKESKKEVNKKRAQEEEYMVKNGGILMEEIMSISNGRCNPIRSFSAEELRIATNNFESFSYKSGIDKWYKTVLEDHPAVLIRTFEHGITVKEACRDIAMASQMSSHGRVLKLVGCCLELPVPALVYEDVEHARLNVCGGIGPRGSSSTLSWKTRLKIAKDIANALTYLHTAFSRPIIHRNVSPITVYLDKDFVPKLTDFCQSLTIPEGETRVETLTYCGFVGFIAPECFDTHSVTEQSDVYSFGVLLLVLLTGRPAHPLDGESENLKELVGEKSWDEIVDRKVLEEGQGVNNEEQKLQLQLEVQAFLHLALRCTRNKEEQRPLMIDVAKQLAQISTSSITEPNY